MRPLGLWEDAWTQSPTPRPAFCSARPRAIVSRPAGPSCPWPPWPPGCRTSTTSSRFSAPKPTCATIGATPIPWSAGRFWPGCWPWSRPGSGKPPGRDGCSCCFIFACFPIFFSIASLLTAPVFFCHSPMSGCRSPRCSSSIRSTPLALVGLALAGSLRPAARKSFAVAGLAVMLAWPALGFGVGRAVAAHARTLACRPGRAGGGRSCPARRLLAAMVEDRGRGGRPVPADRSRPPVAGHARDRTALRKGRARGTGQPWPGRLRSFPSMAGSPISRSNPRPPPRKAPPLTFQDLRFMAVKSAGDQGARFGRAVHPDRLPGLGRPAYPGRLFQMGKGGVDPAPDRPGLLAGGNGDAAFVLAAPGGKRYGDPSAGSPPGDPARFSEEVAHAVSPCQGPVASGNRRPARNRLRFRPGILADRQRGPDLPGFRPGLGRQLPGPCPGRPGQGRLRAGRAPDHPQSRLLQRQDAGAGRPADRRSRPWTGCFSPTAGPKPWKGR